MASKSFTAAHEDLELTLKPGESRTLDRANRYDIFGQLVTGPGQSGIQIDVEAVRAKADPGQMGYQAVRWFRSSIHVKPDEIVGPGRFGDLRCDPARSN